jgi:hypothetical protein
MVTENPWERRGRFPEPVRPPTPRPKFGLAVLNAARKYRSAMDAASVDQRRALVEIMLHRAGDPKLALDALNHLAEEFGFPKFTPADLAKRPPG